MRRRTLLAAATLVALACGAPKPEAPAPTPLPNRPLAGLAGQRVVVLPLHYLRPADTLGWAASIDDPRAFLRDVDDEIAFALGERGFRTSWVFPEALERAAKRNPGYSADPHALAAERLRPLARRTDAMLGEPLASQVRSLVALHDARYALLPVELRFEPVPGTADGRGVLRVALLDARLSRVLLERDILSDPAPALTPAVTATIADRLADLVAAP